MVHKKPEHVTCILKSSTAVSFAYMINCHNDNSFPTNKNYSTQLGDPDRFNQSRILLVVTVHILSTLLYSETAFWVIKCSTIFKLLINVENYTVFFRDSVHPKTYRNLANSSTYLLTPWSRVLLEKLASLQLVKKFPAFYGTRRFLTALTSARHLSLS